MKNIKNSLLNIIFYILLGLGVYLFLNDGNTNVDLRIDSYLLLSFVIFLKLINFFIFNQVHLNIFNLFALNVSKYDNFELTFKGYLGNFFGFGKSGTGYKAFFLKNKYNFSFIKFLSFYLFLQTLTLFLTSLISIIFITINFSNELKNYYALLLLLAIVLSISVLINFISKFFSKIKIIKNTRYLNKIRVTLEELSFLTNNLSLLNRNFKNILIYQLFIQTSLFLQIYLIGSSIGIEVKLLNNFIYNVVSQLSTFISITPNSIGLREILLLISNNYIGLEDSQIINIAILDRITDFSALFVFVFIYVIRKIYLRIR